MKCPDCGKDLSEDEILIPIYDLKKELMGFFHLKHETFQSFLDTCLAAGLDPEKVARDLWKKAIDNCSTVG